MKPNIRLPLVWRVLVSVSLLSLPARAQYSPDATLDLGINYGQLALGQAALSGARAIGESSDRASRAARRPQVQPPQPPMKGSIAFRSTPTVTEIVNQRFITWQSRNHPALRAQIVEEIQSGALQAYFAGILHRYGYAANNLADVSSAYYISLWRIIHGRDPTTRQVVAVQRQTRESMTQDRSLMALSDAAKQEICETFALHAALALQGYEQLARNGDTKTLANFRRGLQATLAPQGPDLAAMAISEHGFVTSER
jgi:hypothetical protein